MLELLPGERSAASPLTRVLRMLQPVALSSSAGNPALEIWPQHLGFSNTPYGTLSPERQIAEVARKLRLILLELDRGERLLPGGPLSPEEYGPSIARIRRALSLANLQQQWATVTRDINPETLGMLSICARAAAPTEVQLSRSDLAPLAEQLERLFQSIAALPARDPLAIFLDEQAEVLRVALEEYPIVGADALRRGVFEVDGSMVEHVGAPAATPATAAEPASVDILRRAVLIGKRAVKVTAAIATLAKSAQLIGQVAAETESFYLPAAERAAQRLIGPSPSVDDVEYTIDGDDDGGSAP